MGLSSSKLTKIALVVLAAGVFYLLTAREHSQRQDMRQAAVDLTPACAEKLSRYGLEAADFYRDARTRLQ
jgi:thiosulfate dehydrogenase